MTIYSKLIKRQCIHVTYNELKGNTVKVFKYVKEKELSKAEDVS